jgi:polar amino acid transport system substrate-binding protein
LLGEALLQNLALGTDYLMIPKIPLNCEAYGLILPNHDPEWKALVDETIKNYAARQLYQKWIASVLPEIESAIKYCEQQKTTPSKIIKLMISLNKFYLLLSDWFQLN